MSIKNNNVAEYGREKGFSLFELLIALFVLAIGLIGYASLQGVGLKSNANASYSTEATFLAMDMADRIMANPSGALANSYLTNTKTNDYNNPGCSLGCSAAQRPARDQHEWEGELSDRLPLGEGMVTDEGGGVFMITVMWDDQRTGAIGTGCGGNKAVDLTCFQVLVRPR